MIGIIGVLAATNLHGRVGPQPNAAGTPNEGRSTSLYGGIDNGFRLTVNRVQRGGALNGRTYIVLR